MFLRTACQLTGYLLLDAADRYRIDRVGLYLTRSGVLASWPVDHFRTLLGACRRDSTELRGVFGDCSPDAGARPTPGTSTWRRRPIVSGSSCSSCSAARRARRLPGVVQPLPESTRRPRKFCTTWCRDRDKVLRRRGLMPGGPRPLPRPA